MQHDFILLDRSRSMEDNGKWAEALGSIDAYVEGIKDVDTRVTLVVFDMPIQSMEFKVLRDNVKPTEWRKLNPEEACPRGWTPLNDAIIQLVALANMKDFSRVTMTIVTDGDENASRQPNHHNRARDLLDECRAKGWVVLMIGCSFNNARQAASYNNLAQNTASVARGQMVNSMRASAGKRGSYGATGQAATMSFTSEEKEEFAKGSDGQGQ